MFVFARSKEDRYLKLGLSNRSLVLSSFFIGNFQHAFLSFFFNGNSRIICQAFQSFQISNILSNICLALLKVPCVFTDAIYDVMGFLVFKKNT